MLRTRDCPSKVAVPDTVARRQRCRIIGPRPEGQIRRPRHDTESQTLQHADRVETRRTHGWVTREYVAAEGALGCDLKRQVLPGISASNNPCPSDVNKGSVTSPDHAHPAPLAEPIFALWRLCAALMHRT